MLTHTVCFCCLHQDSDKPSLAPPPTPGEGSGPYSLHDFALEQSLMSEANQNTSVLALCAAYVPVRARVCVCMCVCVCVCVLHDERRLHSVCSEPSPQDLLTAYGRSAPKGHAWQQCVSQHSPGPLPPPPVPLPSPSCPPPLPFPFSCPLSLCRFVEARRSPDLELVVFPVFANCFLELMLRADSATGDHRLLVQ